MASQFYNVTTNNGDTKIANAIATATKLNITHVVFGDGNGSVPTPDKSRTAMVKEVYRVAPSNYYLHPTIANRLIVEAIIPSNIGGFYIREVGLIADTTVLISDGSVAPIFKEASTDGTREYKLKFALNIVDSGIANITLDSSLIYVTQNTIVNNLTTADATKPLSANQGKILQDTKLDKTANAVSATKLQTARTIGGVSFDGTANINLPGVNTVGNQNTTGNAATATKLQAARTINGVIFDGSGNITITDDTKALLTDFINSKTGNGYQKLPNGLIIQWGRYGGGIFKPTITFPITFPNNVYFVGGSSNPDSTSGGSMLEIVGRPTTSSFSAALDLHDSYNMTGPFFWFAIGH